MPNDFKRKRNQMVENQLQDRDITDEKVLNAFNRVPRERFVTGEYRQEAYSDRPLPIGYDVTISQPYIVAKMCQILKLEGNEKVLDIGTGSGYEAAILAEIGCDVVGIERIEELAEKAANLLNRLEYDVKVIAGDGTNGFAEEAPFDRIKVAAATDEVKDEWKKQLIVGGRIVYPKNTGLYQQLVELRKFKDKFKEISHESVRFVPLVEDN